MQIEDKQMLVPDGRLEMEKEGTKPCYVMVGSMQDIKSFKAGISVTCLDLMRDKAEDMTGYVSGLVLLLAD